MRCRLLHQTVQEPFRYPSKPIASPFDGPCMPGRPRTRTLRKPSRFLSGCDRDATRYPTVTEFSGTVVEQVLSGRCVGAGTRPGNGQFAGDIYSLANTGFPGILLAHFLHVGFSRMYRSPFIDFAAWYLRPTSGCLQIFGLPWVWCKLAYFSQSSNIDRFEMRGYTS